MSNESVILQYLCDRMEPPILCELVRGYLDFMPHAWNIILLKKGKSWVRMVVDACHPHDIREETDPEYYCRLFLFLFLFFLSLSLYFMFDGTLSNSKIGRPCMQHFT